MHDFGSMSPHLSLRAVLMPPAAAALPSASSPLRSCSRMTSTTFSMCLRTLSRLAVCWFCPKSPAASAASVSPSPPPLEAMAGRERGRNKDPKV